jgi:hypothetical protein
LKTHLYIFQLAIYIYNSQLIFFIIFFKGYKEEKSELINKCKLCNEILPLNVVKNNLIKLLKNMIFKLYSSSSFCENGACLESNLQNNLYAGKAC